MPRSMIIGHKSSATNTIMGGTVQVAIRCEIANSNIRLECDLDRYEEQYLQDLWATAWDYARMAVNLIGFQSGAGLITVVDTIIRPRQKPDLMRTQLAALSQQCTAYDLNSTQQIAGIVSSDIAVIRAFKDLVESLIIPNNAVVNCARVMDTIRRMVAPSLNEKAAWEEMRRVLNVSKDYLTFITEASKNARHGNYSATTSTPKLMEVLVRAWAVMNRFLEYKKSGDKPLIDPNFPLLA